MGYTAFLWFMRNTGVFSVCVESPTDHFNHCLHLPTVAVGISAHSGFKWTMFIGLLLWVYIIAVGMRSTTWKERLKLRVAGYPLRATGTCYTGKIWQAMLG